MANPYIDIINVGNTDVDIHDKRIAGIDSTPTSSSDNVVTSGGVYSALAGKANTSDIPDAVEANPTVPSGTTPTALTGLKIGANFYDVAAEISALSNNDIDSIWNTAMA